MKFSELYAPHSHLSYLKIFSIFTGVVLKKKNCGLYFSLPILFKTCHHPGLCFSTYWVTWCLFFKRSIPSLVSAVPSGWSATPNFASHQNIYYSSSGSYLLRFLCNCFWLWSDAFSYLQKYLHPSRPLPFITLKLCLQVWCYCDFHSPSSFSSKSKLFPMTQTRSSLPNCSFCLIAIADPDFFFLFLLYSM